MMEMVKLGDLATIVRGSSPRPQGDPRYYGGAIPRLMIEDLTRDGKYVIPKVDSLTEAGARLSRPMKKGDLVVTVSGRTGVPAILNVDACIHDGFVGFRELSDKINIDYLFHYLSSLTKVTSQQAVGAIFKNLTTDQLKNIEIPLPPLSIQCKIAALLDKADALRRKDRELLQAYEALAQAIFMDMFGDPVKNEKGWEVKKLGEVCNKITDGTHFSPPNQASGIPYITAKHVRKDKVDFYLNPTYVSEAHHKEIYSRCTPVKGDVLYIKDGATTGVAAVNEYDFEFSMLSSLALIKPNLKVLNNYYLVAWLNNETIKETYIRNYMAGAAIRRFTLDKLKRFELLVPPIELQNSFELTIRNMFEQKERLSKSDSESLFQTLLQTSFT
jgi:type I restriction enzyme, S subunit